jgi:serine/threonine protein kinase
LSWASFYLLYTRVLLLRIHQTTVPQPLRRHLLMKVLRRQPPWHNSLISPKPVPASMSNSSGDTISTAFIDGGNMEDWFREVQHPAEKALRSITHHILDALALVHQRGYLHRDVKPQNILMDRQNGLPVLIAFGNARIASGAATSNLTSVLTKGYAPFEQYQTKGRQGAFTDLYSLGAVLYRAIKGVAPDDAADRWDNDNVEPLRRHPPPGYSLEFLATVDKALLMRREDRWQNCGEWVDALTVPDQPPQGASYQASPPPVPEPAPPPTPSSSMSSVARETVSCPSCAQKLGVPLRSKALFYEDGTVTRAALPWR